MRALGCTLTDSSTGNTWRFSTHSAANFGIVDLEKKDSQGNVIGQWGYYNGVQYCSDTIGSKNLGVKQCKLITYNPNGQNDATALATITLDDGTTPELIAGTNAGSAQQLSTGSSVTLSDGTRTASLLEDTDHGSITVGGTALGSGLVSAGSGTNKWTDGSGMTYQFTAYSGADSSIGALHISGGSLGSVDTVTIDNFDLAVAETDLKGFLGIQMQDPNFAIVATAPRGGTSITSAILHTAAVQSSATISSGGLHAFTVKLGVPAATAETVSISLSGIGSSAFAIDLGNGSGLIPLGSGTEVSPQNSLAGQSVAG